MDYNKDYLPLVKTLVNEKRYNHTLGVVEEAIKLANIYNEDVNKARIAASLHDVAKYFPLDEQKELIINNFGIDVFDSIPSGAYHSYSGYVYVRDTLKLDDEDILNSILYHTLGRVNMSILEKIVYVADFIDPSRDTLVSNELREVAYKDIDLALYKMLEYTNNKCINENRKVSKTSLEALDYYGRIINDR